MENNENLSNIRHTLAHLLAQAVLEHYPNALLTLGPSIDNGFYYDIDFGEDKINDENLVILEKTMKQNLTSWKEFTYKEIIKDEAKKYFKNNPYKLELIDEIVSRNEKITLYTCGDFTDLCRGGHTEHPSRQIKVDSFKLDRVSGAYWRGDEKNKMLTRIYGLAFNTKDELDEYEKIREEAKKRDHKKLGRDLDLFSFSELIGSGLPLWTPKGTLLRNLLDQYVGELREKFDYVKVEIPHITKKDLYITSGHWDKFKEELFRITTREGHEFAMKPMNCPHHTQIYARKAWSYKELPQRYANTTMCYRDEQSGELSGLSRARSFSQDDAHVFCRMTQAKEEFLKIWDIVYSFYSSFGFNLDVRLSTHDSKHMEKYLGNEEKWEKAENILKEIIQEKNVTALDGTGEAAFYGPKLDFMAKDSLGREWQVATIQLDMNMPERFDLTCSNEKGEKERIVMLHAAIMGSLERFISILIEHTAGAFPLWLSPVQVAIAPIRNDKHLKYAKEIAEKLKLKEIRVEIIDSDVSFGKKVWEFSKNKIPHLIIVGDKQIESKNISYQTRKINTEAPSLDIDIDIETYIKNIKTLIDSRSNSL